MNRKLIKFILLCAFSVVIFGFNAFCEDDVNINFESEKYIVGQSPNSFSESPWVIETLDYGDSITVETDSVSGSKALKIVNSTTGKSRAYIDIPNITSGIHWYSFDFRAENDVRYFTRLGSLYSDNGWYGVVSLNSSVGYAMWDGFSKYIGKFTDGSYKNIRVYINANTREFQIYWNGESTPKFSGDYKSSSAADIGRIYFEVSNNNSFNGTAGDKTKPSVYWIDNIKIESYKLKLEDHTAENSYIGPDDEITLKFNTALDDSSISASDFQIEENGEIVKAEKYTVSSVDNTTVKISSVNGFKYGEKYKLIIKDSVKPKDAAYKLMSEDYAFEFFVKSIIKSVAGVENEMRYNDPVTPVVTVEDGITYEATYSKDGGEETVLSSGSAISEKGEYVLKITAKDSKDREEVKTLSFTIVDKVVPEAKGVYISGNAETDAILTGNFEFYDVNGDEPGNHIFSWYRCDTADGEYEQILENADTQNYKLTKADENKYIKFGIIPVSKSEPYTDNVVVMTEDAFVGAFKPEIKALKLVPSATTPNKDVVLKAEAEFFDLNGDEKDKFIFNWKKSSDGVNFTPITGEESETYTLKEADKNSYIMCEVTPVSKKAPYNGETEKTEVYKTFFEPVIKSLRIEGVVQADQVLAAFYEYYDENGDEKGEIKHEWIVGGNVVSTEASFSPSSYAGMTLSLRVTPVSKNYPFVGEPVETQPVVVAYSQLAPAPSYGSSSSGGGSSKWFPSSTVQTPASEKKEEQTENVVSFSDTTNHWAKNDIDVLVKKGIVNGITEKEFAPDANITRAQFAAVIARMLSLSEEADAEYLDVKNSDWYSSYVKKVTKAGLMQGSNGSFYPDKNITREEMCVVINNILKYKNVVIDGEKKEFSDENEIASWAKQSVKNASSIGIINGMESNVFSPKENSTRAQMAVILVRLLNRVGGDA